VDSVLKLYMIALLEIRRNYGMTLFSWIWFFVRPLLFISAVFAVIYSGIRGQKLVEISSLEFIKLLGGYSIWYLFSETAIGSINRIRNSKIILLAHKIEPSLLVLVSLFSAIINFSLMYLIVLGWCFLEGLLGIAEVGLAISIYLVAVMHAYTIGSLVLIVSLLKTNTAVIIPVFVQFGFWLTPIFWTPPSAGIGYWIANVNPLYFPIVMLKQDLIGGEAINLQLLLLTLMLSIVIAVVSYMTCKFLTRNAQDFI
jgi:lipopolysaccharide transport system permease protein